MATTTTCSVRSIGQEREKAGVKTERGRWSAFRWRPRKKQTQTSPIPIKQPPFSEFIAASPLLPSTGLSLPSIAANLPEWISLSKTLAESLKLAPDRSSWSGSQRSRVFQYYLPVFFWVRAQLEDKKAREIAGSGSPSSAPLVVGIQAPQGCGKTTLVAELETLLASVGLRAASVSVDDFYLTFEGQQKLASEFAGNPLLELRGNAGSHDLALGAETLERLVRGEEGAIALPRYDKSLHGGRGDRAPPRGLARRRGPRRRRPLRGVDARVQARRGRQGARGLAAPARGRRLPGGVRARVGLEVRLLAGGPGHQGTLVRLRLEAAGGEAAAGGLGGQGDDRRAGQGFRGPVPAGVRGVSSRRGRAGTAREQEREGFGDRGRGRQEPVEGAAGAAEGAVIVNQHAMW